MEVIIRAYEQRDAADLADVFFRSVRQVAISDYTPAQVRAWAPERRTPGQSPHQWASDGRLVLLATDENDRAVAFIDLEPDGRIDHIFCAPEAAGQGIASQLYEAAETAAHQQEISRLYTEASELARWTHPWPTPSCTRWTVVTTPRSSRWNGRSKTSTSRSAPPAARRRRSWSRCLARWHAAVAAGHGRQDISAARLALPTPDHTD
ncbi:MAG TPA: GNAT family N-acetyltransferase [Streptosporangiaceae bacterium]